MNKEFLGGEYESGGCGPALAWSRVHSPLLSARRVPPEAGGGAGIYAPSLRLKKLACGWYGVGHTNRRQPGDMRGTAIGKKGRFKAGMSERGGDL